METKPMNNFTEILEAVSVTPADLLKNEPNWVVFRINGIKTELKKSQKGFGFVAAYDNAEIAQLIKDEFPGATDTKGARYWFNTAEELLDIVVQTKELIVRAQLEHLRHTPALRTPDENFFKLEATALHFLASIGCFDRVFSRETFDAHDALITKAQSKAFAARKAADPDYKGYREHLVPCILIQHEIVRLVKSGATSADIENLLRDNLAIAMITDEEAKLIDSRYKTTMPSDWEFGDSIFARLDAFNIETV